MLAIESVNKTYEYEKLEIEKFQISKDKSLKIKEEFFGIRNRK